MSFESTDLTQCAHTDVISGASLAGMLPPNKGGGGASPSDVSKSEACGEAPERITSIADFEYCDLGLGMAVKAACPGRRREKVPLSRRDGDDLSCHDRLVHPSTSLALGYWTKAREVSAVDGFASLARSRTPAEVRVIVSRTLADQD